MSPCLPVTLAVGRLLAATVGRLQEFRFATVGRLREFLVATVGRLQEFLVATAGRLQWFLVVVCILYFFDHRLLMLFSEGTEEEFAEHEPHTPMVHRTSTRSARTPHPSGAHTSHAPSRQTTRRTAPRTPEEEARSVPEEPQAESYDEPQSERSLTPPPEPIPYRGPASQRDRAPTDVSGVRDEDEPISHPALPGQIPTSQPGRVTPVVDPHDAERAANLDAMEEHLGELTKHAEEAENSREDVFKDNEDARQQLFRQAEERREAEAQAARDALLQTLATLGEHGAPPPAAIPGGGPSDDGGDDSDRSSLRSRHSDHTIPPGRPESIAASVHDAVARHSQELREIVDLEREELQRSREEAREENERLRQALQEEHNRVNSMKDAQIEELQEELRRLREEVEVEKAQRAADDAERREQDLAEAGNRHDDLRKDLSEILGLINQQREAMEEKKQMCQERDAGKEERRMKKENDKLLHGEWLQTIMEKMEECKGDLEKLKTEGASKTG